MKWEKYDEEAWNSKDGKYEIILDYAYLNKESEKIVYHLCLNSANGPEIAEYSTLEDAQEAVEAIERKSLK